MNSQRENQRNINFAYMHVYIYIYMCVCVCVQPGFSLYYKLKSRDFYQSSEGRASVKELEIGARRAEGSASVEVTQSLVFGSLEIGPRRAEGMVDCFTLILCYALCVCNQNLGHVSKSTKKKKQNKTKKKTKKQNTKKQN